MSARSKRATIAGAKSKRRAAVRIDREPTAAAPFLSAASNPARKCCPLSTILIELMVFVRHCPQQPPRAIRRAIIDADNPGTGQVAPHIPWTTFARVASAL